MPYLATEEGIRPQLKTSPLEPLSDSEMQGHNSRRPAPLGISVRALLAREAEREGFQREELSEEEEVGDAGINTSAGIFRERLKGTEDVSITAVMTVQEKNSSKLE
ncbi:hypothetical protein DY000_02036564 [Brassica cretica]|uniref:Uncharacterized protein n=1 Tax=Brassica cretica TaxID=69181 RepID=A0ABQ7BDK5_BRACR|nr:hypothetical protein DY000_02036564 [Brassica cretica]